MGEELTAACAVPAGYTITRPDEALPTYIPKRTVTVRDSVDASGSETAV